jgi:hypothetical protein
MYDWLLGRNRGIDLWQFLFYTCSWENHVDPKVYTITSTPYTSKKWWYWIWCLVLRDCMIFSMFYKFSYYIWIVSDLLCGTRISYKCFTYNIFQLFRNFELFSWMDKNPPNVLSELHCMYWIDQFWSIFQCKTQLVFFIANVRFYK